MPLIEPIHTVPSLPAISDVMMSFLSGKSIYSIYPLLRLWHSIPSVVDIHSLPSLPTSAASICLASMCIMLLNSSVLGLCMNIFARSKSTSYPLYVPIGVQEDLVSKLGCRRVSRRLAGEYLYVTFPDISISPFCVVHRLTGTPKSFISCSAVGFGRTKGVSAPLFLLNRKSPF